MEIIAQPTSVTRGTTLLLEHCDRVARLQCIGPCAAERLEQALGTDLARLLGRGLASDAHSGLRLVSPDFVRPG